MQSSYLYTTYIPLKVANKTWIIPEEEKIGYIEDSDTKHVLTLSEYNSGSNIFLTVQMIMRLSIK